MFKIVSSQPVITSHKLTKEVSKLPAREILKSRFSQEELKSTSPWWKARIDFTESAKNAKVFKSNYERTAPETLSAQDQNVLWKRAKQLKDEFTVGMLSHEEIHPVKSFTEGGTTKCVVDEERMRVNRSVEREVAWSKKNESKVREFKNIMRHLNPDDPNAGDVERYRPKLRGTT